MPKTKRRKRGSDHMRFVNNNSTSRKALSVVPTPDVETHDRVADEGAVYARLIAKLGAEKYHELRRQMLDLAA